MSDATKQYIDGPLDSGETVEALNWSRLFTDLTPHARGGIGEVFRATDPQLHRTVAVKCLQERQVVNPDSRQRFLLEAEVTARLEHPGVVPVYGLVAGGDRPAYSMRFVEGKTFAEEIASYHAGPNPIAFRRLLQSFFQVCQTVAYAHSRGVIHRDLKPANVMLGKFGETLVVDWGLAKVVGRQEEVRATGVGETLIPSSADSGPGETAMGSAVGTPAYMSPEQAAGRWDVVAQASDIYGLGAVLYTVLTGKPPLEPGNWPQMQQKIQQGDFPRPRQVKPDVPKPLEAVCLQAMALKTQDRYASAAALGTEVEHWLADEPVSAYRDTLATRSRRWAIRNRTVASTAAVLLVAVVVGLSIGAVLLQQAQVETENQRKAAVTSQRKAEAINRFLIDDLLKQADPVNNPAGEKLTVRELLDKAADRLGLQSNLNNQPEVEAELRTVIGHAYENLVVYDRAEPHYRRAWELQAIRLGRECPDTLSVRNRLIRAVVDMELPEAEATALDALDVCRRVFGERHRETAEATNNLAELRHIQNRLAEAVPLRRRACAAALAASGPDDYKTLEYENNLGVTLVVAGKPGEAVGILESVAERRKRLNPLDPELATTLQNLGGAFIHIGRFADAEAVLQRAVALQTQLRGPKNPGTLAALNLLAHSVEGQERWSVAEEKYRAVLQDRRRYELPQNRTGVERTLANMTRMYAKQERWAEACASLTELILSQHPDPSRKPEALTVTLAAAFGDGNDPVKAGSLLNESWKVLGARTWTGDWLTGEVASRYGDCLTRQGKYAEAEPILLAAAGDITKAVGVPAWGVAAARKRLADLYDAWKKPIEAVKWR